mgnify:CR=1 FL=1
MVVHRAEAVVLRHIPRRRRRCVVQVLLQHRGQATNLAGVFHRARRDLAGVHGVAGRHANTPSRASIETVKAVSCRLELLDAIAQPADDLAFERIYNQPKRGLGAKTLEAMRRHARRTQMPLAAASLDLADSDELPAPGFDIDRPRPSDLWTYAMAQVFVGVSPAMAADAAETTAAAAEPMDLAPIGAGLAAIGSGAAAIGVGHVAGNFLAGALRNPSAAAGQTASLLLQGSANFMSAVGQSRPRHLGPGQLRDRAPTVGDPVEGAVVERDEHPVGRRMDICFDISVSEGDGTLVGSGLRLHHLVRHGGAADLVGHQHERTAGG